MATEDGLRGRQILAGRYKKAPVPLAGWRNFYGTMKETLLSTAVRIPLSQGKYAIVDPDDAERVSRVRWSVVGAGLTKYARTSSRNIGKAQRLMHRMVLGYSDGQPIDHINGNGLDNRKSNLRLATTQENNRNQFLQNRHDRTSGFKGVSRYGRRWTSSINLGDGVAIVVGRFDCEADAARAYDEASLKHFGEFARTNEMMRLYPGQSPLERNSQLATGPVAQKPEYCATGYNKARDAILYDAPRKKKELIVTRTKRGEITLTSPRRN